MQLKQLLKQLLVKAKFLLALVLSSLIFLTIFLFLDSRFRIHRIILENNFSSITLRGLAEFNNSRTLLLSTVNIERKIRLQNPQIKEVVVRIVYPDSIHIFISPFEPLAYFVVKDGYYVLSDGGKIIEKVKKTGVDLPQINYYQKFDFKSRQIGEKLDYRDVIMAISIIKYSQEFNLAIDSIDIGGLNMIVCRIKDKKIFFTTEKAREKQLYEFGTVVRQFKIQGKDFKSLDLRFNKPIVLF